MATRIINATLPATDNGWLHNASLTIGGGKITALDFSRAPVIEQGAVDLNGARLLPGFIDTQVNGGGGVLFNDEPSLAGLRTISEAHRAFGTTGLLPTLISDDLAVMERAIAAVDKAFASGLPGILGIHLEGPFLNSERKGVHNPDKFRLIDNNALNLLCSLKHGVTLVTLAPETTTPDIIKKLRMHGVIVAAGHTAATYGQTRLALDNGVTSFTHLFNAMTPMSSREPGVVGAALEDTGSWCGIIVDGFHVHPATLRNALNAKAKGKMILVTDAMPSVGAEHKTFQLNGETITAEGGRCATATGTLAGSDLDMFSAVNNTVDKLRCSWPEAGRMASQYPAEMLGLENTYGAISCGKSADFVVLNERDQLQEVWQQGVRYTQ
ncbi:N-acetylglucosamine-6-phosphate deacetylase [Teredinibacter turnerae]|uniref:N-acetylglucosamine-6-phosphate deacetylase n=1 Tax=Teredinibacter turnerae TaxID=2426 RepID=UPI000360C1B7|nr:N-acetylglucosamine-6-phosphate deacetylase [Teredinibacter turnerae]